MKHIAFFSGGAGSWKVGKILIDKFGMENTVLLFTDTYIEDDSTYKFLVQSSQQLYGIDHTDILETLANIPAVSNETMQERKVFLRELAQKVMSRNKNFIWVSDGRTPWEIFYHVNWIGNSRIAQCSHYLKQKSAEKAITDHFKENECILYLGIDWTESHRIKAPTESWKPYKVEFPLCEDEHVYSKEQIFDEIKSLNIDIPELYKLGFSHNNCGGFCVRAGQGHFINLLQKNPELFRYHEEREKEMIEYLGKDVSILRKQDNGYKYTYTLEELRKDYEKNTGTIDMQDIGGCGCFVS